MSSVRASHPEDRARLPKLIQPAVATILFLATAGFTLWQNTRIAVLWDLSFLLDSAWRFSLGQVPYRDLPFSHAPLTFLVQAAILHLFGRVYWHTIAYAALAGGVATVLTLHLLRWILRPLGAGSFWLAPLLAAPLAVLSIYSVYPHPIYDSDAILAVLAAFALLVRALEDRNESRRSALVWSTIAGLACVLPIFFKQNVGLVFFSTTLLALAATAIARRVRSAPITRELCITAAALLGLAAAVAALNAWAGLGNYLHWTVQFAAQRRLPGLGVVLLAYHQQSLLWSLPCAAAALWLLSKRTASTLRHTLVTLLLAAPFLWTILSLALTTDPDDRADQLLSLWPHTLLLAAVLAILNLCRRPELRTLLPWILLATIHGTFLSQQLWGSTYAIWPLLLLLIAFLLVELAAIALPLVATISATFLLCGGLYAASHERLSYVHLDGIPTHASPPSLRGITTPGPWLPGFEELLRFAAAEIPPTDGILLIPGEDPFFYATGRTPAYPVLLFDPATFPYTPQQAADTARTAGIRWLILKRTLQLTATPYDQLPALTTALQQDFVLHRRLTLYDIYRRR